MTSQVDFNEPACSVLCSFFSMNKHCQTVKCLIIPWEIVQVSIKIAKHPGHYVQIFFIFYFLTFID